MKKEYDFTQDIRLVDEKELDKISDSFHKNKDEGCVGVFGINSTNSDFELYELVDELKYLVDDIKLSDFQHIFVYITETRKKLPYAIKPFIKIDLKTEMVYFLDSENEDDDKIVFEKKGLKIRYMKALKEKFTKN